MGCKNAVQNILWFYYLNPIQMNAKAWRAPESSEEPSTHLSFIHYIKKGVWTT